MLSRLQISHSFSHSKGNVNEAHAAKTGLIVNVKQIGILWYYENIILSKIYGIDIPMQNCTDLYGLCFTFLSIWSTYVQRKYNMFMQYAKHRAEYWFLFFFAF